MDVPVACSPHVPLHLQKQHHHQAQAQAQAHKQKSTTVAAAITANAAVTPRSAAAAAASLVPAAAAAATVSVPPAASSSASLAATTTSTVPSSSVAPATAAVAKKKQAVSYAADRVIDTGSFGVVYEARVVESGERVAIKKVLQDRRFKNRELQIMSLLAHVNVIALKHCFYSKGDANPKTGEEPLYLNLVMNFVPSTLHRTLRAHEKRPLPTFLVRLYVYQIARAIHYIHSLGVCHRDIKPQNLLLNSRTHELQLCDFGSAKVLIPGEPNVSYICSRYYRAPELVFEATNYTGAIDVWSAGCVMGEMMLGTPLFPGDSSVDQLIEIIKVVGSPSKEDIHAMNPHNTSFSFPTIQAQPMTKVFRGKASADAMDLLQSMLRYNPTTRIQPLDVLAHPFFDPLREEHAGTAAQAGTTKDVPLPPSLFAFTSEELATMRRRGTLEKIVPKHLRASIVMPPPDA